MSIDKAREAVAIQRNAPVQGFSAGIPWSLHLEAYDAYCVAYSPQPALIEGGCRGGFGVGELDKFIPGWRERVSEIANLRATLATQAAELAEFAERAGAKAAEVFEQRSRAERAEAERDAAVGLVYAIGKCSYPVCTSHDPRGHRWSEAYLDKLRPAILAARQQEKES